MLPEGFAALEGFVAEWALDSTDQRIVKRGTSTPDQIRAFHQAMVEFAPSALEYLNARDIYRLDEAESNHMKLVLALGHTAMAVEVQRTTHQPGIRYPHGIRVTHGLPLLG